MQIVELKTVDLIEYDNNPRKNENAVQYVAESIRNFGFKVPVIVDANNVIIAGHTRVKAAKYLGLESVPCIIADDLTEEQIQAFRLADNKVSEFAEWDEEKLAIELGDIINIDMSDFGFMIDLGEEKKKDTFEGVVKFSEELLLTHNYIVLYFDNEFDWLVAQEKFDLKQVKDLIPRKSQPTGIGRVVDGKKVLEWLN